MDILNAEFARLLVSAGWKQAEAAKQLELSPAVITRYMSNETRPSLTVLKLFKLLIGDVQPLPGAEPGVMNGELEGPLDATERQLIVQLRGLEEAERRRVAQGFCALLAIMTASRKRAQVKPVSRRARRKRVVTEGK